MCAYVTYVTYGMVLNINIFAKQINENVNYNVVIRLNFKFISNETYSRNQELNGYTNSHLCACNTCKNI